jgi:acyl-CoA thioesterase FadM
MMMLFKYELRNLLAWCLLFAPDGMRCVLGLIPWHSRGQASTRRQDRVVVGSADTTTAFTSVPADVRFTTPPMQVYIEDTDAYGVMYNGNYLRCYDRALHMATQDEPRGEVLLMGHAHEGWSLLAVAQQKFQSSPALGGSFVVEGVLKESDSSPGNDWELWDMTMKSADGDTIYNTISGVKIAKPEEEDATSVSSFRVASVEPLDHSRTDTSTAICYDHFRTYRDEFDSHLRGHLPLRNVLNLFERSRTNWLGGPESLRKLQKQEGVVFVVTRIEDCSLLPNNGCRPGQQLTVETSFVPKRRGMMIQCTQILKAGDTPLAQGKITIMTLDETTRRPTSKLPLWLQERMGIS